MTKVILNRYKPFQIWEKKNMRIAAVFLALLIFTSCSNYSKVYLLDDAKAVKRYVKSDNHKKRQPSYFVHFKGGTYYLESPSVKFISDDILLSLSGTLREQDVNLKEIRDTIQYYYVFKLSDDFNEESILNSEFNTLKIDYPVKRYEHIYKTRVLAYFVGALAGTAGIILSFYALVKNSFSY